ncbi:MAG: hypothetical protein D3922_12505, partial [Candidatus Electrothrix sp. AR1]|nr:hypothetical protein [Candidatus Electrothrix sp. AR1]
HHYNEKGTTLLIATHDHSIYNYPGSKVVIIEQGRMLVAGDSGDATDATTPKAAGSGHQEDKLGEQIIINRNLGAVRKKGVEV